MPTNYNIESFIVLGNVSFSGFEGSAGSTLSWTSTSLPDNTDNTLVDLDDDTRLDVGTEGFSTFTFSGYTYNFSGFFGAVGIFKHNVLDLYVAAFPVDDPDTLFPMSGTSEVYSAEIFAYPLSFAKGSMIATTGGEQPVEALHIGDRVTTASGETVPVKWVGRQTLRKWGHGAHMQPVRIRAGALGGGLPHSDLTVTADHGKVLDGYVINASALVNGDTIGFVPMAELEDSFTVDHIETEAHDVILANGAPSETFIDAAGRAAFDNHQEYLDLYGVERFIPENPLPRITSARLLPADLAARIGLGTARRRMELTA